MINGILCFPHSVLLFAFKAIKNVFLQLLFLDIYLVISSSQTSTHIVIVIGSDV